MAEVRRLGDALMHGAAEDYLTFIYKVTVFSNLIVNLLIESLSVIFGKFSGFQSFLIICKISSLFSSICSAFPPLGSSRLSIFSIPD